MSNVAFDKILLLMDQDAIRDKFAHHADGGTCISASAFAVALDDLGVRKDQHEIDELMQKCLKKDGTISETDFLAAVASKSKMEMMLDSLPIVRALSSSLLPGKDSSHPIERFLELTKEEITKKVSDAVEVITAIVLKQHEILCESAEEDVIAFSKSNSKFKFEGRGGSLEDFRTNAADRVGVCHVDPLKGMELEHLQSLSSDFEFTTSNYVVKTTPKIEYRLATTGGSYYKDWVRRKDQGEDVPALSSLEKLMVKNKGEPLNRFGPERIIRPLAEYRELPVVQRATLSDAEIIAVVLYTGPMHVLWNTTLRAYAPHLANVYSSSRHVLASAIKKIKHSSHELQACMSLYRGLSGGKLPREIFAPNEDGSIGMTDFGFQSTTSDLHVAVDYSGVDAGHMATVLELKVGQVDSGAYLGDLSQYPSEKEFLWQCISYLHASGEPRVETTRDGFLVRIVPVRINANDRPMTLEELQHCRKDVDGNRKDHVKDIYENIELEIRRELELLKKDPWVAIRAAGNLYCDIDKIFEKMHKWFRDHVDEMDSSWFNVEANYKSIIGQCIEWKTKLDSLAGEESTFHERNKYIAVTLCRFHGLIDSSTDELWDDKSRTTILMNCAEIGNLDGTLLLINAGADVNAQDAAGLTAAMRAIKSGRVEVVNLLVGSPNMDMNLKDACGFSTLHHALRAKDIDLVHMTAAVTDVNLGDNDGRTPLMHAAISGQREVVELLLKKFQADSNLKDKKGRTALHFTSMKARRVGLVRIICDVADVNIQDNKGWTPLICASRERLIETVELLCREFQADANLQDTKGCAALHYAVRARDSESVRVISNFADVNIQDNEGHTALMHAADTAQPKVVNFLLTEVQADANLRDTSGWTALHFAVQAKNTHLTRMIASVTDVDIQDNGGHTALMYAASTGQMDTVELLCTEFHADVNIKTVVNETATMWACTSGYGNIVKFLIEMRGADIVEGDNSGQTLLHFAASGGHMSIIQFLVQLGVEVDMPDSIGCTPFMHACVQEHLEVAKWLVMETNADKCHRSSEGTTALMLASEMGHVDVIEWLLLDPKVEVDECNEDGLTALMYACDSGHIEVVKHLVEKGANPNATSRDGNTPLMCASEEDHFAVINFLIQRRMSWHENASKHNEGEQESV